jgi:AraC family transcriptional regulator
MIKTLLLSIATVLVTLCVYLYIHLGIAKPVSLKVEKRGPFSLLFKPHMGPYYLINGVIKEVESWALSHNIACSKTFGEYIDNPATVDEDRLRSRGGCVLTTPIETPPQELEYQNRGERLYVVAEFSGSPAVSPYKVYPKVQEYLIEQRLKSSGPVVEIYTVNGNQMTTEYLFAIDNPTPTPPSSPVN